MKLIEDTRQKIGMHDVKNQYWVEHGHSVIRCKLPFGDYAIVPSIAVDTKQDMSEIVNNLTTEHKRFREECKLAKEYGCQLVILVENEDGITQIRDIANWKNPRRFVSPKAPKGEQIMRSMFTMQERYGVRFEFCTPDEAGAKVLEILEEGRGNG